MSLPPPPPHRRPPVAVFYRTPAEMTSIAVDKITSINVVAPKNVSVDGIWKVRISMGADTVEREFATDWYMPEAKGYMVKAFAMARDDAVVFARELAAQLSSVKERSDVRTL